MRVAWLIVWTSLAVWPQGALAQQIGVWLPLETRLAPVAAAVLEGVRQGLPEDAPEPIVAGSDCGAAEAEAAASALEAASVIIGPFCYEGARAMARRLSRPVIAISVQAPTLARDRGYGNLPLLAIGRDAGAEAKAIVEQALPQLGGVPFVVLHDGSLHGRGLADQIRLLGENSPGKPVSVEAFRPFQANYRAFLRRVARSGAKAALIAGSAEDALTMLNDLKALDVDWTVIVGEQASLLPQIADKDAVPAQTLLVVEEGTPVDTTERLISIGRAAVGLARTVSQTGEVTTIDGVETPDGRISVTKEGRVVLFPLTVKRWSQIVSKEVGN